MFWAAVSLMILFAAFLLFCLFVGYFFEFRAAGADAAPRFRPAALHLAQIANQFNESSEDGSSRVTLRSSSSSEMIFMSSAIPLVLY